MLQMLSEDFRINSPVNVPNSDNSINWKAKGCTTFGKYAVVFHKNINQHLH